MSIESLLGERIANAREARGLSQQQLAHRLGVKKSTVANWENERSAPRANRMNHIAGVLEVSVVWLIAGGESPPSIKTPRLNETRNIESKLARAENLINQLSALMVELRGQTRRIQRELDAQN